jgi:hypothetical protein
MNLNEALMLDCRRGGGSAMGAPRRRCSVSRGTARVKTQFYSVSRILYSVFLYKSVFYIAPPQAFSTAAGVAKCLAAPAGAGRRGLSHGAGYCTLSITLHREYSPPSPFGAAECIPHTRRRWQRVVEGALLPARDGARRRPIPRGGPRRIRCARITNAVTQLTGNPPDPPSPSVTGSCL